MTSVLDLNGIKELFKKGMNYARDKFSSPFYSKNDALCDYQLSLVNKATDLTTLMSAVTLPNYVIGNCFHPPKPICDGCELSNSSFHFGMGSIEWYFIYGIYGNYGVNISFTKQEIAPPHVVDIDPSEAVRWLIGGGFGIVGGEWYNIQQEYIYMKYSKTNDYTFSLSGSGNKISATLEVNGMNIIVILTFKDKNNINHSISLTLSANTPASPNSPGSCGECKGGLGVLYYSYTNMNMVISNVDGSAVQPGTQKSNGWVDHELIKSSIGNTWYFQSVVTFLKLLYKTSSNGWLWFAIQDNQTGLQYMLVHHFGNKTYEDDILGNPDQNIPMDTVNVYKDGLTHFSPTEKSMNYKDLDVRLADTVTVNGLKLPSKYKITLPGGKKVILQNACAPNVCNNPFKPYENPAYLYDLDGNVIGTGLIEANFYLRNEQIALNLVSAAGGNITDPNEINIVLSGMVPVQSGSQKFLGVLYALLPVWILLGICFFVFYKKDDRYKRAAISLVFLLVLYLLML
jgi:hypothetical protein